MTTTRKGPRKAIEKHHRMEEQGIVKKEALAEGEDLPGEIIPPIPPNEYAGGDNPVSRDMRESREKARDQLNKTPPPG